MKHSTLLLSSLTMLSLCGSQVQARPQRLLILGDSLTEGYGVAREASFPSVLQTLLVNAGHSNVTVINAGISGSTSASGPSRLRWQLQKPPDLLVLELGANDGLRGLPISEIRKNLVTMIEMAQARHIPILLTGMKLPPNLGPDYVASFDGLFPALAEKYHLAFMPFLLEGVAGDRSLNQEDGVHPNEKGQQIVAHNVLKYVLPML